MLSDILQETNKHFTLDNKENGTLKKEQNMSIKVSKLKQILENALSDLEGLDDDQEVKLVSNTYFLGHTNYFLGISGYDGGYLDLNDIKVEDDEEEESDE